MGTASSYDIRYSASAITASNWDSAIQLTGEPLPLAAGSSQSYTVVGLSSNTAYYFAIKTTDAAGNISNISNIVAITTQAFTLSVSLSASPSSGIAPLAVSLTAQVGGTVSGNANYTFIVIALIPAPTLLFLMPPNMTMFHKPLIRQQMFVIIQRQELIPLKSL